MQKIFIWKTYHSQNKLFYFSNPPKVYLDNTSLTQEEITALFQSGKANNTQYAKEKKIIEEEKEYITDIKEPKITFISTEDIKPNGLIVRDIQVIYFGLQAPTF